jgi:hypothetical protein
MKTRIVVGTVVAFVLSYGTADAAITNFCEMAYQAGEKTSSWWNPWYMVWALSGC